MGSTFKNVLLFIGALAIGGGVTYFSSSLIPFLDDQSRLIIGVVLVIFAYISLYYMTKGGGG
ncbi:hypothetical protein HY988_01775 [Candidatus Micrarchaeota archaeon]|nr:hypothetical protein [Candidatus Micrarchaeota archaeon]